MTRLTNKFSPNLGYLYAIISAVIFGASTPAAKVLLHSVNPILLAGLFYLGSGVGLSIVYLIQYFLSHNFFNEAPLQRKGLKWLAGAILSGGILAPIFLMLGLIKTDASYASLLLNLEMVFTVVCAWLIFKEHVSRSITLGMLSIVIGSILLSWKGHFDMRALMGPSFIALACFCWAIDNNITRKISGSNPIQIVMLKSLIAGVTNTLLALCLGAKLPSLIIIISAAGVGLITYGMSLLCFIIGLRHIGTARTGAYFSLAPFVGATLAILFLNEPLTLQIIIAGIFMGFGIWLHLNEKHEHSHTHEPLEHCHKHTHDEHHQHTHQASDPGGELHTHWHKHEVLTHVHQHFPDIHHRHKHQL